MAGEPWNRVNIPYPGSVSTVRINFNAKTDVVVRNVLGENEKVLNLFESEVLQTEIRVLYELLYVLNNSHRNNKTFRALKQVEQCINRLKMMKLKVVLKDLKDLCPAKVQRGVGIRTGECVVPSQPFLEWFCLKVLGAIKLLSCTMNRCSTAFLLSRRQMKWGEFIILNMVLTSMVSRLWVIFRGILSCLCPLYERLLQLLKEVASSQPMPYLRDVVLPECVADFLGPFDDPTLTAMVPFVPPRAKVCQPQQRKTRQRKTRQRKTRVQVKNKTRKQEDLGVVVERVIAHHTDLKPFLTTKGKYLSQQTQKTSGGQLLMKKVRRAESFADLVSQLQTTIAWCKTQKKKKRQFLNFLSFKCQRMKCLEAQGCNVHRKLQALKRDICRILSDRGYAMSTCGATAARMKGNSHLVTRFHTQRSRFKSLNARKKWKKRQQEKKQPSAPAPSGREQNKKVRSEVAASHDDIDDIFASIGE